MSLWLFSYSCSYSYLLLFIVIVIVNVNNTGCESFIALFRPINGAWYFACMYQTQ